MAALNIQDAHAFTAHDERNGQFRTHAVDGVDVPGVLGRIADANRMAGGPGRPGYSLPHGDAQAFREFPRIADGKPVTEIASVPFDHQYAEDFVINVSLDERRGARQDFI